MIGIGFGSVKNDLAFVFPLPTPVEAVYRGGDLAVGILRTGNNEHDKFARADFAVAQIQRKQRTMLFVMETKI